MKCINSSCVTYFRFCRSIKSSIILQTFWKRNNTHLVNNGWCWPKHIPFSFGFNTGYHFRGNSSPHFCWMIVAMRSWIESLAELSYFCFALAHYGCDWTLPVDHITSTSLDTESVASRGDEFLLSTFGTFVDYFVGDSVIVNWLLLVHG